MTLLQPPPFAIRITPVDDRTIRIAVEGDIDLVTAPEFGRVLRAQISERHDIVLDFSKTTFMDSSGVKVVIEGIQRTRSDCLRLSLDPGAPRQVRRLFEITGVKAVVQDERADLSLQHTVAG